MLHSRITLSLFIVVLAGCDQLITITRDFREGFSVARADEIMTKSTSLLQTNHSSAGVSDVACPVRFTRSGEIATFLVRRRRAQFHLRRRT
jgi:hypothetical protein